MVPKAFRPGFMVAAHLSIEIVKKIDVIPLGDVVENFV